MKKETIKFKYRYTPGEWRQKPDGSLEYSREGVKPREDTIILPIEKSPFLNQMLKDCRELFPWARQGN